MAEEEKIDAPVEPEYDADLDNYRGTLEETSQQDKLQALEAKMKARLVKADAEKATEQEAPGTQAIPIDTEARDKARNVVRETAVGVTEAPAQALGGALDAVGNVSSGLSNAAGAFADVVGLPDLNFPESGNKTIDTVAHALANPLDTLSKSGDLISQPTTLVGGGVREISKFMVAFIPFMRAAKLVGLTGATRAVAAGGATGFSALDPEDPSLSNVIAETPIPKILKKPFALLSTNPNDPELLNRAKNMVTEAGVGLGAEAVVKVIQVAIKARNAAKADPDKFLPAVITDDMTSALGNNTDPLVSPRTARAKKGPKTPREKLSEADEAIRKDAEIRRAGLQVVDINSKEQVFINFAKINAPDDVKATMQGMADAFKGTIKEAQRGKITQAQTKKLAEDLGMSVEDLLARRKGEAFNAEQVFAARELYTASGKKVEELALRAAAATSSEVDQFMLRKSLATHYAIQTEVLGARTEGARALGAWKIPSNGEDAARAISELMERHGGSGVTKDLALRIASASAKGNLSPGALTIMARRGWMATSKDMVKEAYVLGMLWKPTTHMINILSNSTMLGMQISERAIAAQVRRSGISGAGDGVKIGEATAMLNAVPDAFGDAIEYAGKAFRSGETGRVMGKTELREATITSERVAVERGMAPAEHAAFTESAIGKGIDMFGKVTRMPGNALAGEDEFFKTIAYRMEVGALATRTVSQEGLDGAAAAAKVARILQDPPPNIRLEAADAALYSTFQNTPGRLVRGIMMARDSGSMNPSFLLLPFLRTLGNISAATFERSPVAFLTQRWRGDMAAGGARRDIAIARAGLGTVMLSSINELANSGIVSGAGPRDRADREALERDGWSRWSINVDGTFVPYDRLDPIGSVLALGAGIHDAFNETELAEDDLTEWETSLAPVAIVLGESMLNKTWAQGITTAITAIRTAQSGGTGLQIGVTVGRGLVPFSSAFDFVREFNDPVRREPLNPFDAMQSRLPVFSKNVLKRRDLWGEAIQPQEVWGKTFDKISPIRVTREKNSPIDQEMVRVQGGVERIGPKSSFDSVRINFRKFPEVYDEYRTLAGNGLKDPARGNMGARDFLNAVVTDKSPFSALYNTMTDDSKADFISNTISGYRSKAAKQIMSEGKHSEFIIEVNKRKQQEFQESLPEGIEAPTVFGN